MNHCRRVASHSFVRFLWCAGVALGVACGSAPAAASEADRCIASLLEPAAAPDPAAFWSADRLMLASRRAAGERFVYHIVGDIVELTPERFPLLATEPGRSLEDVAEISVDAREIILSMPIRLKDGTIRLHADRVSVTGGGSLSVTSPPAKEDQLVEIIAGTLDLSRAPAMPFVLQTQGWILNTPPKWPTSATAKRLLRIKVRDLVPEAGASEASTRQLKDDPLRWIHNRTADQGFDSGFPKSLWSAGYEVAIGDAAYETLFAADLLWPDMTVAKLARLRAQAPFDPTVGDFIRAKIDELAPRFARRSSRQAVRALAQMQEQMDLELDPFGYRADEVPMSALPERVAAFRKSLGEVLGAGKKAGSLQLWDQARLAALASGQMADPAKQIDQLDRMLRSAITDRTTAARRITANTAQLLKLLADGQAKLAEAMGIQEQLLGQYESEKAQASSFGRVVDELLVDDMVIGIGRPAAAPYALRSDPAATAPASFYGTVDGDPPPSPPANLREIAARYQTYAVLIGDFNAAWSAADGHAAPALGHLGGKLNNDAELEAFTAAMKAVFGQSAALRAALPDGPAEFMLEFTDFTAIDPERNGRWLGLLKEAEAAMTGIGPRHAAIEADLRRVRAADADIRWLSAVRDDLVALKSLPKEAAGQRLAMLTAIMRARLLTGLARSAAALDKASFYIFGQATTIDAALGPNDDALASERLDLRHPDRFDPAQMQVALEAERGALAQYYESFAAGMAERVAGFAEKQPAAAFGVDFFRAAYEDDLGQELEAAYHKSRFLDSLNRSIAAQIELGRAGMGFASNPILIPIAITPPGASEGPQFLLDVAVIKLRFQDQPQLQGGINLRVEHPRWGRIQVDGTCRRVVEAPDGAEGIETGYSKTISLARDVKENWNEAIAADGAFAKLPDNVFPANAPYYVYVDVTQRGAWPKPPVIDEIEILFIKTGTALQ